MMLKFHDDDCGELLEKLNKREIKFAGIRKHWTS